MNSSNKYSFADSMPTFCLAANAVYSFQLLRSDVADKSCLVWTPYFWRKPKYTSSDPNLRVHFKCTLVLSVVVVVAVA